MKKRNWKEIIVITFCAIDILAFSSQAISNVKGLFNKNNDTENETAVVHVLEEV
jgi:hypothetical protein